MTPLLIAAHDGRLAEVRALLAAGASVNQAMEDGATPLFISAQQGHLDVVKALVAAGASVDQAREDGTMHRSTSRRRRATSTWCRRWWRRARAWTRRT